MRIGGAVKLREINGYYTCLVTFEWMRTYVNNSEVYKEYLYDFLKPTVYKRVLALNQVHIDLNVRTGERCGGG
jgi:hypothetical protein